MRVCIDYGHGDSWLRWLTRTGEIMADLAGFRVGIEFSPDWWCVEWPELGCR